MVEKDLADRVRAYAERHSISLAAAVSFLLSRALEQEEQS
jgi:hypothetical protein